MARSQDRQAERALSRSHGCETRGRRRTRGGNEEDGNADRGVPGATGRRAAGPQSRAPAARRPGKLPLPVRASDRPGDVPHRLQYRPRGGAPAGRAGGRRRRPRRPRRSRARQGIALLYGYPERGADGRVYNAALLLDRNGRRLANHRKTPSLRRRSTAAPSRPATGPDRGRARRPEGRHSDLLRCRVSRERRLLALQGVELVRCRRPHGAASLRPPARWSRRAPTRTRCSSPTPTAAAREGELELCRPVLRRRPGRARPRPRRRRRGADPGRPRPGAARRLAPAQHLPRRPPARSSTRAGLATRKPA